MKNRSLTIAILFLTTAISATTTTTPTAETQQIQTVKMGDSINLSDYSSKAPFAVPDNLTFFFTSNRHVQNSKHTKSKDNVYMATCLSLQNPWQVIGSVAISSDEE
jgi:hypothetical protein